MDTGTPAKNLFGTDGDVGAADSDDDTAALARVRGVLTPAEKINAAVRHVCDERDAERSGFTAEDDATTAGGFCSGPEEEGEEQGDASEGEESTQACDTNTNEPRADSRPMTHGP